MRCLIFNLIANKIKGHAKEQDCLLVLLEVVAYECPVEGPTDLCLAVTDTDLSAGRDEGEESEMFLGLLEEILDGSDKEE